MNDVQDILRNLTVPAGRSGPDVVAADVARGRQAVTRRQRRRFTVAGALAVVAVAATVGLSQIEVSTDPSRPRGQQLHLVAYTGEQPVGFKVSTVPDGWRVVSSDESAFVVEPAGRAPVDAGSPSAAAAAQDAGVASGAVSYEGRIVVSLQGESHFPEESAVREVEVGGRTGRLGHPLEAPGKLSDTRWLFFPDVTGRNVNVQVPGNVGLSEEQIVDFAEGITVTGDVVEPKG